jgi:hypothetical protein
MARYPDRRSAALPALGGAALPRLVLAGGDRAGRLRDARDPRLPERRRDLLRHVRARAGRAPQRLRVHEHLLLAARRRRALRGRSRPPPARTRRSTCATSNASAPATSRRWCPSTTSTTARSAKSRRAASGRGPARRARAAARAALSRLRGPPPPSERGDEQCATRSCFKDIDEPNLATLAVYERRGGYEALRKALAMTQDAVLAELDASGLRGRGGAGFPAGRKARSCPRATWTSTSSATPTSPSPAPSRTAS